MKSKLVPINVQRAFAGILAIVAIAAFLDALRAGVRDAFALSGNPSTLTGLFMRHVYSSQWADMLLLAAGFAGVSAGILGILLARNRPRNAPVRQMMMALCLGAFCLAYLFVLCVSPALRHFLDASLLFSFAADAIFLSLIVHLEFLFARFFVWYPRLITETEWADSYSNRARKLRHESIPKRLFAFLFQADGLFTFVNEKQLASVAQKRAREYRWLMHPNAKLWLFGCAILLTAVGHVVLYIGPAGLRSFNQFIQLGIVGIAAVGGISSIFLLMLSPLFAFVFIIEALKIQEKTGEEERRRVQWIYGPMDAISGIWVVLFAVLSFNVIAKAATGGIFAVQTLLDRTLGNPAILLALLATIFAALLMGMAVSIFYLGALDPKLAVKRISVWSIVGILIAFIFLALERFVATKLVAFLGWNLDYGSVIAAPVAATCFVPLRKTVDRLISNLVDRLMPTHFVTSGEKVWRTIAFSDLSGYSALSVADEQRAILLAAVLFAQAKSAAQKHEGRVVKSLGDAVIMEFDSAETGIAGVKALHLGFINACAAVGVEPLPIHSGIHSGEVLIALDGDVYGQTVNLAARLQDVASGGQIVVSDAVRSKAETDSHKFLSVGIKTLKNIPEPVPCFLVSLH
jgi:class 3 adenylate cyclase